MGLVRFGNNLSTSLATGIDDSVLTMDINVGDGVDMPTLSTGDWFMLTLNNAGGDIEIVKVTDVSVDTLTIVRGQEGTTPRAWLAGDSIENRLTVGSLESIANNEEDWTIVSNSNELYDALIRQDKNIFMKNGLYDLTPFSSIPFYSNLNLKGEKLPSNNDYNGNEDSGVYLIHASKFSFTGGMVEDTFVSISPVTRGDRTLVVGIGLTPATVYEAGTLILYDDYLYVTKDEVTVSGGGGATFTFTNEIVKDSVGITSMSFMSVDDLYHDINFENICVCISPLILGGIVNSTFKNISGGNLASLGGAFWFYYSHNLNFENIGGDYDYFQCWQCTNIKADGIIGVEGLNFYLSSKFNVENVKHATLSCLLSYDFTYTNSKTDFSIWAEDSQYFIIDGVYSSHVDVVNKDTLKLTDSSNFTITNCDVIDQTTSFIDLTGASDYKIFGNMWQGTPSATFSQAFSPGVNYDSVDTAGIGTYFEEGDEWYDSVLKTKFICADASAGAAVWRQELINGSISSIETDAIAPTDLTIDCGAEKTIVLERVVWDDLPPQPIITAGIGAANRPTLTAFLGNLEEYTFAIGDYVYGTFETLHGYKEGSDGEFHVHYVTNGTDVDDRGVNWEIEYTVANIDGSFSAPTVVSIEDLIPASTPDRTHMYHDLTVVVGSGILIGAYVLWRLRRIASVTNPAPTANPFGLAFGIHIQKDTIGSRTEHVK